MVLQILLWYSSFPSCDTGTAHRCVSDTHREGEREQVRERERERERESGREWERERERERESGRERLDTHIITQYMQIMLT